MDEMQNRLSRGLCRVRKPDNYGEVLRRHLPSFVVTAPFLIAARIIPQGIQFAPDCLFRRFTGMPCMFCGYTRAFQRIAHFDSHGVLTDNPAAVVLFAFMFVVMVWNLAGLFACRIITPGRLLRVGRRRFVFSGVVIFFILNWVYRIISSSDCLVCP